MTGLQEKYCVPPITKSMVKQRLVLLLLSIWDTYYMHDRYVLGEGLGTTRRQRVVNSIAMTRYRRTASYPIDGAEFPDAKATDDYG
jgi:hypothetical protein